MVVDDLHTHTHTRLMSGFSLYDRAPSHHRSHSFTTGYSDLRSLGRLKANSEVKNAEIFSITVLPSKPQSHAQGQEFPGCSTV